MGNGPGGGPGQFLIGPRPRGFGGYDTGVSVLAIALHALIWVLIIMALVWLAREIIRLIQRGPRHHVPPPPSPAIAELDMMYARGELSRADYLVRRTDLAGPPPPVQPG